MTNQERIDRATADLKACVGDSRERYAKAELIEALLANETDPEASPVICKSINDWIDELKQERAAALECKAPATGAQELVALVAQAKAEWEKADQAATLEYLSEEPMDLAALNDIAQALWEIYDGLRADLDEAEAEFRADANGDRF